jgi:hypothetical protein
VTIDQSCKGYVQNYRTKAEIYNASAGERSGRWRRNERRDGTGVAERAAYLTQNALGLLKGTNIMWTRTKLMGLAAVLLFTAITGAAAESATEQSPQKPKAPAASYDPVPPAWSIAMNVPGWLSVGAEYCTRRGQCKVVGEELGPIPLGDGRTAPPAIGCRLNPDYPACVSGRMPVQLLARAPPLGSVIVRLQETNYAVGGLTWAVERADGTAVGGPIMLESGGELLPLHYLLTGQTRAARLATQQKIDAHRKAVIAGILSVRRKRCDELLTVTKAEGGVFTATCKVKGREKKYEESVSGLE